MKVEALATAGVVAAILIADRISREAPRRAKGGSSKPHPGAKGKPPPEPEQIDPADLVFSIHALNRIDELDLTVEGVRAVVGERRREQNQQYADCWIYRGLPSGSTVDILVSVTKRTKVVKTVMTA